MMWWFCLFICLPFVCSALRNDNDTIVFNYNNRYKYNVNYTIDVNKHLEYIMEFAGDVESYDTPARVTVASDYANRTYPLFVTARQQKGVFSWQLPKIVQTQNSLELFTSISRTLCPHNNMFDEQKDTCDITSQNTPIVHLTTSSPTNITVTIIVETVEDFYVHHNETLNFTVTPSQPVYYFYPFKESNMNMKFLKAKRNLMCNNKLSGEEKYILSDNFRGHIVGRNSVSYTTPKSVIVEITSDNDVCAVVSIQNFSCPVFDNERDILYDGFYLTMTRRGGITITQDLFPVGFYIVFIVKSTDDDCVVQSSMPNNETLPTVAKYFGWDSVEGKVQFYSNDGRVKNFSFKIVHTISYREYLIGGGAVLAAFLSFYLIFFIAICSKRSKKANDDVSTLADMRATVTAESAQVTPDDANSHAATQPGSYTVPIDTSSRRNLVETNTPTDTIDECSSDSDSEHSTPGDELRGTAAYAESPEKLCVASLAKKTARVLSARSRMYLFHILTVAIFYTLPVIQLVVTYQRMLNQSGNQDLCYFNFLCAHPFMVLSDFNHVYSNIGYVLLGLLFLIQVWRRHKQYRGKTAEEKELGIPQHFGLLYAMGIALVSEGILSAAYHVCPNSMNFQFDTSFMYVTSVLCMVKIYQNRHPDINARAHATFGVLALIIFIGLVGVLNANFYFWIAFTILHLVTCFYMTLKIYYMGRLKLNGAVVYRAAGRLVRRPLLAVTPTHCGRMVLLFIANLANWAIAAYGVSQHKPDFASHLLLVLMSNLFLYTLFYIVMKLLYRERIYWYSWIFIVLTYGTWFSSSYFFLDQSTNWSVTPAQSRNSNQFCTLLQLYDSHDIWHFLSAMAMFFSFNMYLTIDDSLYKQSRSNIMVF